MMRLYVLALASIAAVGCGPPCLDDRCSLTPPSAQTTKTDYTNVQPKDAGTVAVAMPSGNGSATGSGGVGSGSTVPPPVVAAGSGSAAPPIAAGSGSAAPPVAPAVPTTKSATWIALDGDRTKMWVISTTALPTASTIKFDFVRTPEKTPFVISLETRSAGTTLPEAVWNDCPEGKIRCDASGTKKHTTRRAGQIQMAAGINWALTDVTDQGGATLVTWTNNLSRELVTIKLTR